MGFLKSAPERIKVEVVQSTHGNTFVTWPVDMTTSARELPALPVGQTHPRSRHWLMGDRTVVLVLPGDPNVHMGGVIRWPFDVVESSWNNRTKTLASKVVHPNDPEVHFVITTSGTGCACTQGPAGNAGPIGEPYQIEMVNPNNPDYDWYTVMTP